MELLMMRESLNQWISENSQLMEGEMGKSEAILAAKDMVDSIQDMLEKVSKMQVEQMPALIDTIRDQIGNEQADAFKNSVGQLLSGMLDSMTQAREQADGAARQLAGEQMAPTSMAMGGGAPGAPGIGGDELAGMAAGEVPGGEAPLSDMDAFGTSDAAAGGAQALGREKR
jgi:flagellar hook-basal body complex protein FliE